MEMGCYGIGVSRLMPVIVEEWHDTKGIKWPLHAAPFSAVIVLLAKKAEDREYLTSEAEELYHKLGSSVPELFEDMIIDEREEQAGAKFFEADLVGYPYKIIMGGNYRGSGKVELEDRMTGTKETMSKEDLIRFFRGKFNANVGQDV